jgi:hypothetical protein
MTGNLQGLSQQIAEFTCPEIPGTPIRYQDILSSSLQKSLRRAEYCCALTAAKGLIDRDAKYFWRRLVTIAFEDFGPSDLSLTAGIVAAARNRDWRGRTGGDFRVAAFLIEQLVRTPTDRRVDNLYMLAAAASRYGEYAELLESCSPGVARLVRDAMAMARTCERPVPGRSFKSVVPKACDQVIWSCADITQELAGLCVDGRKLCQCLLPVLLPLLLGEAGKDDGPYVLETEALGSPSLGGVLLAALDGYTAIGRSILYSVLQENRALSEIVARASWVSPLRAAAALLFAVEGGQLRNHLSDPLGQELEQLSQGCWSGLPGAVLTEAFARIREAIPLIDARRAEFLRNCTTDTNQIHRRLT